MKNLYRKILSQSSTYTIGNLVQQGLSIVLLPLYTRYLSLADFGILSLMDLTIFLINRPIVTPFLSAFMRFYYKPAYESKNGLFLFNLFFILVIKTLLFGVMYYLFTNSLNSFLFVEEGKIYLPIVKAYLLILIFQPLSAFLLKFIVMREMAKYYIFISLGKVVLVTGATVYFLSSWQLGVLAVVYGSILGSGFEVLVALPILLKHSTFKFSTAIVYEPLRYGYPMILSGYSNTLMDSGDRYLLNILTSVSSVGLYSFGYKIARVVNLLLVTPIKQTIGPIIYQKEKNPQEQKQLIVNVTTYFYFVGMFMALGLSLLAKEVIILLASQPEFWDAWIIVPIITFSYVQFGLGSFLSWGVILKNKSQYISGMVLVGALLNIVLNLVFIPYWGVLGAAFATLISYLALNAMYIYYSAKFYDLHFELGRLYYITLSGVAFFFLTLFVANLNSLLMNIAIKILILSLYPLFFLITNFFTTQEKQYILTLWYKGLNLCPNRKKLPIQ